MASLGPNVIVVFATHPRSAGSVQGPPAPAPGHTSTCCLESPVTSVSSPCPLACTGTLAGPAGLHPDQVSRHQHASLSIQVREETRGPRRSISSFHLLFTVSLSETGTRPMTGWSWRIPGLVQEPWSKKEPHRPGARSCSCPLHPRPTPRENTPAVGQQGFHRAKEGPQARSQ